MEKHNPQNIPFAFFGTPYVARDTLSTLLNAGYTPTIVVTSPDAKKGRGLIETPCATRMFAESKGLPVLTPEKLDAEFLKELESYGCQYALVVAYGKLLPQQVLDTFPLGILNIHYSLLPKYRGAAPVEYALLSGDEKTGITIQKMVLAMDAGDIVAQQEVLINRHETIRELRPRLIVAGAELLIDTLPSFLNGTAAHTPQDPAQVTVAPKIPKDMGLLSLTADSGKNWRIYRALSESPGTYFFANKENKRIRVKIKEARLENETFIIERIVPEGKPEQNFSWLAQNGWLPE